MQGASLSLYIGSHLALKKKIYQFNNQTFGSFRKGNAPDVEEDIWLDSQEVADMLHISTRTLQRLRTDNLIDYTFERGKCKYRFSEIERKVNEKIINCEPHLIDEFRKNVLLRGE